MKTLSKSIFTHRMAAAVLVTLISTACATHQSIEEGYSSCDQVFNQSLPIAVDDAKHRVNNGCDTEFFQIFRELMKVAEGDPKRENKKVFSDFLEWGANEGIVSKRQARETYTEYFGTKFVSALSDYNTCAAFCPIQEDLKKNMQQELVSKDFGILKISGDRELYNRASLLHDELELVITATCSACEANQQQAARY